MDVSASGLAHRTMKRVIQVLALESHSGHALYCLTGKIRLLYRETSLFAGAPYYVTWEA